MGQTNLQDRAILETNLDNPTPEETAEQQRRADEILFDKICEDYTEAEKQRIYAKFLKAVESSGVDVERTYEDISIKKGHLRDILNLGGFTGKKGKPLLLDDAKHARIGKAYLDHYNRARRILRV